MSELTITLDDGPWVRPGSRLGGTCEWRLDGDARAIAVHLLWYTEGKGTQDIEVVATSRVERPEIRGRHDFSFELAANAPYSFAGTLISLTWAVEAVVDPDGATERVHLVVGPRPSEVRLEPVPDE